MDKAERRLTTLDSLLLNEAGNAEAQNSTQAAKNFYPGDVSVSPQTGLATVHFTIPAFANLTLSLSYSSLAALYDSPFKFPRGVNLMGIPFIYKNDTGHDALNINGQDYYLDSHYASALTGGELYYSGLKYQTSKNISFKDFRKATGQPALVIQDKHGHASSMEVYYQLTMLDNQGGSLRYCFDQQGFCFAVTTQYFRNDTADNYKYVTLLEYDKNATEDVFYSKLKWITDRHGNKVNFTYDNRGKSITLTYPVNVSGAAYQAYVYQHSSEMIFGHSLNDALDYRLVMDTDGSRCARVEEVIFSKATNQSTCNKMYRLTYQDAQNPYAVSKLEIVDGHDASNKMTTKYDYTGDREHTFKYGFDEAYDSPDINTLKPTYSTVVTTGKNTTVHHYNKLSQEIKMEIRSLISTTASTLGDLIGAIYTVYPKVVAYDPETRTNKLKANYQSPTQQRVVLYDKDAAGQIMPAIVMKKLSAYGDFGEILAAKSYPMVKFLAFEPGHHGEVQLPEYAEQLQAVTESITEYDYQRVVTAIKQTQTDHTTGKVAIQEAMLTKDKLNVARKTAWATDTSGKETQSLKTTEYTYVCDDNSRGESNDYDASTVRREKTFFPDNPDECIIRDYTYNLAGNAENQFGQLTVKTTTRVYSPQDVPESVTTEVSVNGLAVRQIGATGLITATTYDVSGNLVTQKDPAGVTEMRGYDYLKRIYRADIRDRTGTETYLDQLNAYDFIGQVLYSKERNEQDGAVGSYKTEVTDYDYARGGRAANSIDADGNRFDLFYDTYRGLLAKKAYYQKDDQGELVLYGDEIYQYAVGYFDNAINNGCFAITKTKDGAHGSQTKFKALNKDTVYEQTDWVNGRIKAKVVNDYTLSGVLLSAQSYVPGDENTEQAMRLHSQQQHHYDLLGRLERVAHTLFDAAQNKAQAFDLCYTYDAWQVEQAVLQTRVTPEGEFKTYRTHYDLLGQVVGQSYSVGDKVLSTRIAYNAAGDVISEADFSRNTQHNTYHEKTGLLVQSVYKDDAGSTQNTVTNDYDAFSRIDQQVSQDGCRVKEVFNAIGLAKQLIFGIPKTVNADLDQDQATTLYDDQNRVKQYTDMNGLVFDVAYLPSGDTKQVLIAQQDGQQVGAMRYEHYAYSASTPLVVNRVKASHFHFDYEGVTYQMTNTMAYDDQGRLEQEVSDDGTQQYTTTYTYNDLDQVITKTSTATGPTHSDSNVNVKETYSYTVMNQLASSESIDLIDQTKTVNTYVYDDNGNLTEQVTCTEGDAATRRKLIFTYNQANQLLQKTTSLDMTGQASTTQTVTYQYNNNGNVIGEYGGDGVITQYGYNAQNQLVLVNGPQGDIHYAYYPTGQRALKRHENESHAYFYDVDGNLVNALLVGATAESPVLKLASCFGHFRYIQDQQRQNSALQIGHMRLNKCNNIAVVQASVAPTYQTQRVSDYGVVSHQITDGILDQMPYPYLYGAGYFDPETDLHYMQARYYSPTQKRFLAQDNADYESLPNRYIYALSNPVMFNDQDGHVSNFWAGMTLIGTALLNLASGNVGGAAIDVGFATLYFTDVIDAPQTSGEEALFFTMNAVGVLASLAAVKNTFRVMREKLPDVAVQREEQVILPPHGKNLRLLDETMTEEIVQVADMPPGGQYLLHENANAVHGAPRASLQGYWDANPAHGRRCPIRRAVPARWDNMQFAHGPDFLGRYTINRTVYERPYTLARYKEANLKLRSMASHRTYSCPLYRSLREATSATAWGDVIPIIYQYS